MARSGAGAAAPQERRTLERAAGLAFVELTLAPGSKGLCVVALEPFPRHDHFDGATRQHIAALLANLLLAAPGHR